MTFKSFDVTSLNMERNNSPLWWGASCILVEWRPLWFSIYQNFGGLLWQEMNGRCEPESGHDSIKCHDDPKAKLGRQPQTGQLHPSQDTVDNILGEKILISNSMRRIWHQSAMTPPQWGSETRTGGAPSCLWIKTSASGFAIHVGPRPWNWWWAWTFGLAA